MLKYTIDQSWKDVSIWDLCPSEGKKQQLYNKTLIFFETMVASGLVNTCGFKYKPSLWELTGTFTG